MAKSLKELIQDLQSQDAVTRATAAVLLGEMDAKDAIPFLLSALEDINEEVRRQAKIALDRLAENQSKPRSHVVTLSPELTAQVRKKLSGKNDE